MLTVAGLRQWLAAGGVTEPIHRNRMPESPADVVVITPSGGFELRTEDAFDTPSFQLRLRNSDPEVAERRAQEIDALILDAARPFAVGGARVIGVGRVGGSPAYLETSPQGWVTYSTNYWMEIER